MDGKILELMKRGMGDFALVTLAWSKDGEDLVLSFRPPGSTAYLTMTLAWATDVAMRMDFGEYAGMPLVYSSHIEALPGGRWLFEVTFGAAPEGFLRCKCNQIELEGDYAALPSRTEALRTTR